MPAIFNSTNEEQHVTVFGKHFTFKPKQIKVMNESVGKYLATNRMEQGIIGLPDQFEEDRNYQDTEEGKQTLAELEARALEAYLAFHRAIVANNQVSLRADLERANLKTDPATLASKGELASARIVASYQRSKEDVAQKRADEMKKLVTEIKKGE